MSPPIAARTIRRLGNDRQIKRSNPGSAISGCTKNAPVASNKPSRLRPRRWQASAVMIKASAGKRAVKNCSEIRNTPEPP